MFNLEFRGWRKVTPSFKDEDMKKRRYGKIVLLIVTVCIGGFLWWFVSTKEVRAEEAQYERLVRFANRQTVEIAVIKQAAELQKLKAEIQKPK